MSAEVALGGAVVAWVHRAAGSSVRTATGLTGGYSSQMLRLDLTDGRRVVLRRMHQDPWRRHAVELLTREAGVQELLADAGFPVPRPLAVDADGSETGVPSLLMTCLPGRIDLVSADHGRLADLARALVRLHRFIPPEDRWPRDYQSWAFEAKRQVPEWSRDDGLYREAFARLAGEPPAYERTFLHRDFQPGNVLWQGDQVSGVVDWVETSTGPADLDVAHCASNMATLHGAEAALAFRAAYVEAGGRVAEDPEAAAYWQVLDLVGFLPAGGRESGAVPATMLDTWTAHGRRDLTPEAARDAREDLLRLTLRG